MTNEPYRSLADVNEVELKDALIEMCIKLGIHGSGNGYSLYVAVFSEHEKAIKHRHIYDDVPEPDHG